MTTDIDASQERGAVDELRGVVVGVLLGIGSDKSPLVAFPGSPDAAIRARSTVALRASDIGCQVALLFENGEYEKPLLIGKIVVPGREEIPASKIVTAKLDQEVLTLSADRQIVLQCGEASITLTQAGKIILRGTHLVSRSSGANKIKGGSVQIN